jgi:hypothetical protein
VKLVGGNRKLGVMTAFRKWRDLIVFDVFAFPSCRQCRVCLVLPDSSVLGQSLTPAYLLILGSYLILTFH